MRISDWSSDVCSSDLLSISTLGIVPFRSKKELLHRAEQGQQSAQEELAVVQAARAAADRRVADAERRAKQAELVALHEAKIAGKRGRGRGRKVHKARKAVQRGAALGLLSDLVGAAQPAGGRAPQARPT